MSLYDKRPLVLLWIAGKIPNKYWNALSVEMLIYECCCCSLVTEGHRCPLLGPSTDNNAFLSVRSVGTTPWTSLRMVVQSTSDAVS
jgi:hypothetical protein